MNKAILTHQENAAVPVLSSTRAAIYARSATRCEQGSAYALDKQVTACCRYCDERNYLLDAQHIYQDIASGADLRNRPRLHALRRAARMNAFDIVVLLDMDRLSRNPLHVQALINELEAVGIQAVPVEKHAETEHQLITRLTTLSSEVQYRAHQDHPQHIQENEQGCTHYDPCTHHSSYGDSTALVTGNWCLSCRNMRESVQLSEYSHGRYWIKEPLCFVCANVRHATAVQYDKLGNELRSQPFTLWLQQQSRHL